VSARLEACCLSRCACICDKSCVTWAQRVRPGFQQRIEEKSRVCANACADSPLQRGRDERVRGSADTYTCGRKVLRPVNRGTKKVAAIRTPHRTTATHSPSQSSTHPTHPPTHLQSAGTACCRLSCGGACAWGCRQAHVEQLSAGRHPTRKCSQERYPRLEQRAALAHVQYFCE
jgi:hypothetical protein